MAKCPKRSVSKEKHGESLSGPPIDLGIVATCLGYTEAEVVAAVVKAGVDVSDPVQFLGMVVGLAEARPEAGKFIEFQYGVN